MATTLREQGADTVLVIERDADHTEEAWRRRFPAALGWFLDPSRRPAQRDHKTATDREGL